MAVQRRMVLRNWQGAKFGLTGRLATTTSGSKPRGRCEMGVYASVLVNQPRKTPQGDVYTYRGGFNARYEDDDREKAIIERAEARWHGRGPVLVCEHGEEGDKVFYQEKPRAIHYDTDDPDGVLVGYLHKAKVNGRKRWVVVSRDKAIRNTWNGLRYFAIGHGIEMPELVRETPNEVYDYWCACKGEPFPSSEYWPALARIKAWAVENLCNRWFEHGRWWRGVKPEHRGTYRELEAMEDLLDDERQHWRDCEDNIGCAKRNLEREERWWCGPGPGMTEEQRDKALDDALYEVYERFDTRRRLASTLAVAGFGVLASSLRIKGCPVEGKRHARLALANQ
jgi:hypothetical protein